MGYTMALTVLEQTLWPLEKEERPGVPENASVFTPFSTISGYAGLKSDPSMLPTGPALATLCILNYVMNRIIIEQYWQRPTSVAPRLVTYEERKHFATPGSFLSPEEWMRGNARTHPAGETLIFPPLSPMVATDRCMREHNELAGGGKRPIIDETYNPVSHRPFLWIKAAEVGGWLTDLRLRRGSSIRASDVLACDSVAQAVVEARENYLLALGKVNFRVLVTTGGTDYEGEVPAL